MKLYSIPFFVIGRRVTLTYECRLRFRGSGLYDRDEMVFEYDSDDADASIFVTSDGDIDFDLLSGFAVTKIGTYLDDRFHDGYMLNRSEEDLRNSALQLIVNYNSGHGDLRFSLHRFLRLIREVGRVS